MPPCRFSSPPYASRRFRFRRFSGLILIFLRYFRRRCCVAMPLLAYYSRRRLPFADFLPAVSLIFRPDAPSRLSRLFSPMPRARCRSAAARCRARSARAQQCVYRSICAARTLMMALCCAIRVMLLRSDILRARAAPRARTRIVSAAFVMLLQHMPTRCRHIFATFSPLFTIDADATVRRANAVPRAGSQVQAASARACRDTLCGAAAFVHVAPWCRPRHATTMPRHDDAHSRLITIRLLIPPSLIFSLMSCHDIFPAPMLISLLPLFTLLPLISLMPSRHALPFATLRH